MMKSNCGRCLPAVRKAITDIDPMNAYDIDPSTEKYLRTDRGSIEARSISRKPLQLIADKGRLCPTDFATGPALPSHSAASITKKIIAIMDRLLTTHVVPYTPYKVSYSLLKNQNENAARNNMMHSVSINKSNTYKVLRIDMTASWSATFSAAFARFSIWSAKYLRWNFSLSLSEGILWKTLRLMVWEYLTASFS